MRAEAWSLRGGTTAFDAELSALVRGVELCCLQAAPGATFNIFTDSQAAMLRLQDDRSGPGQQLAARDIQVAKEACRRGADININWVPGHTGVLGNEVTDQWAVDAASREHKARTGGGIDQTLRATGQKTSKAFLKSVLRRRAIDGWRRDIERRSRGKRPYRIPKRGEIPRIPKELQRVPKELASPFFQLSSGHAMIAPFLKEKLGGQSLIRVGGAVEKDKVVSISLKSAGHGRKRLERYGRL